mmetsp:Transcript_49619/g.105969  ORF Transcript_49619/g.105969 Transcript_49619/m.105969 type:complete len:261 (-) Transcript_49619:2125-2907(-)
MMKSLPPATVLKALMSASIVSEALNCCKTSETKPSRVRHGSPASSGAENLTNCACSSSSDISKPMARKAPLNSSSWSEPFFDLSKCVCAFLISSYCSGEIWSWACASCASMNECLSRITFSSCETLVSSDVSVSRVYGLSSAAASSRKSESSCAGCSCACLASRALELRCSSSATSICLPRMSDPGSSSRIAIAGAATSSACFCCRTNSSTASAAVAKACFCFSMCCWRSRASCSCEVLSSAQRLTSPMMRCSSSRSKRE